MHSRPGSSRKLYLDFDGDLFLNRLELAGAAFRIRPYTTDDDKFRHSILEMQAILSAFEEVAEDFAPFDIDVTLESPGKSVLVSDRAIRGLALVRLLDERELGGSGVDITPAVGGLQTKTWGSSQTDFPAEIYNAGRFSMGASFSHEFGHSFTLVHDGLGSAEYHGGQSVGSITWGPIMGAAFGSVLRQWSNGDYPGSTSTQDDLGLIGSYLPLLQDDHSNQKTNATDATPIVIIAGAGTSAGLIEQRSDVDVFRFDLPQTSLATIAVESPSLAPNLDILAELYGPSGALVTANNGYDALGAFISLQLPPGIYTLAVDGVGKTGTAASYSDYGSIGRFQVTLNVSASRGEVIGLLNQVIVQRQRLDSSVILEHTSRKNGMLSQMPYTLAIIPAIIEPQEIVTLVTSLQRADAVTTLPSHNGTDAKRGTRLHQKRLHDESRKFFRRAIDGLVFGTKSASITG